MATELSNRETALPHPHNCSDDNYNGVCQVCGFDEDTITTPMKCHCSDCKCDQESMRDFTLCGFCEDNCENPQVVKSGVSLVKKDA